VAHLDGSGFMTDEEFRADLLAATVSRAETHESGMREAFVAEIAERLREAGELPEIEHCAETLLGSRGRRLELDAYAFDEADSSLNLFCAIYDGGTGAPATISLTDARTNGFGRMRGLFDQARDGWLTSSIEESRPLFSLARRIQTGDKLTALRLHVLTDRAISERLREISPEETTDGIPVTFQVWDVTRLKRVHDARSVRSDLFVDLSSLPGGGLLVLPATSGFADYESYLAVVPGSALADIFIRHGSRLLEGNVRTFLGRKGSANTGMAKTVAEHPERFFAYNNGISATASEIAVADGPGQTRIITGITNLQIVNGAQTTASLAALRREGKHPLDAVSVMMKLSVVPDAEVAEALVPLISRYANTQNGVRASDFFASSAFHRRMEEISRRIIAPAVDGSLTQTHWYYERARGQYLNDQVGLSTAKKELFARRNPRSQVIVKTAMAKVETCFDLLPDIACRGAEKAFTAFAERVTDDWKDEAKRSTYGDDWYRSAVARSILFTAAERVVSGASWFEKGSGYRSQIVAYTIARLAALAKDMTRGGRLDYLRVWAAQTAGSVLDNQMLLIAGEMRGVLQSPPVAGQNVGEWAKNQACRKRALETDVPVDPAFDTFLVGKEDTRAEKRQDREKQRVADGLNSLREVIEAGGAYWQAVRTFARTRRMATPDEDVALGIASSVPKRIPTDQQAGRLLALKGRCTEAGFVPPN
jgi:hypothetical protein